MKNKKLVALAIAGILGVGAIAGGTLAYFTDSDSKINVITMGHVDIDLTETWDPEDGKNVKPNETIVKIPEIKLKDGSEDAFVRAKIEITGALNDVEKAELLKGIDIQDGWYLSTDGYYYFNQMFEKASDGLKSATLFTQVHIPETWNNEQADKTFNIEVSAEGIQADNFEPTKDQNGNITGWFLSNGDPVDVKAYNANK